MYIIYIYNIIILYIYIYYIIFKKKKNSSPCTPVLLTPEFFNIK